MIFALLRWLYENLMKPSEMRCVTCGEGIRDGQRVIMYRGELHHLSCASYRRRFRT